MAEYEIAGFWRRLFADLLDSLVLTVPIGFVIGLFTGDFWPMEWADNYTWNIVYALYCTILPVYWNGYVIGKRILNIRVANLNQEKLSFKTMILREIVGKHLLGYVTFGISIIVSAFMVGLRRDKRAIHDFIAGTYVAKD
ncbi:hypothetical protein A8F94_15715 [Bacillus sp. FJAT-27225]|uniref:RDD family protein n=1 Tax=Bacillus sp. FJAT-27225 TaxID=1743144 RepID=UPI00080C337A|nr:hypothetical protein A8F94_15715 [Bacillus sp. FJAT-27225]